MEKCICVCFTCFALFQGFICIEKTKQNKKPKTKAKQNKETNKQSYLTLWMKTSCQLASRFIFLSFIEPMKDCVEKCDSNFEFNIYALEAFGKLENYTLYIEIDQRY